MKKKLLFAALLKNAKEGIDPRNLFTFPKEWRTFFTNLRRFKNTYAGKYSIKTTPIFFESKRLTFDPHYVIQGYWATDRILKNGLPSVHVDISSSLPFSAQLSASCPVIQLEYRPPALTLPGFHRISGNVLRLPFADKCLQSLSCLHAIEHVGLGRYGDPLDADGIQKALGELERVLAPAGDLLLAVPVGRPVVHFNAGYIFNPEDICRKLSGLTLLEFSCVDDQKNFIANADMRHVSTMEYALGLFHFKRP